MVLSEIKMGKNNIFCNVLLIAQEFVHHLCFVLTLKVF